MPQGPRKGESKEKFLSRCIGYLISKENKSRKNASGQCYDMWRKRNKKKK